MRFSLAAIVACAGLASAQLAVTDILYDINELTNLTLAIVPSAQQLSVNTAVYLPWGQGPWAQLITGLSTLVNTAAGDATTLVNQDSANYTLAQSTQIAAAFAKLTAAQNALLDALNSKVGLIRQVPIVGPIIYTLLSGYRSSSNTIGYSFVVSVAPSLQAGLRTTLNGVTSNLDTTLRGFLNLS